MDDHLYNGENTMVKIQWHDSRVPISSSDTRIFMQDTVSQTTAGVSHNRFKGDTITDEYCTLLTVSPNNKLLQYLAQAKIHYK